ncbi:SAM-dependent methyltransferase [Rhabdobacter roseus]|uniref:16S rRNA (Cytidine1402-2'-O)-methyltransferase n=1 Tax=Rhabdobacter roseus TaxID=1655419 RepID=A0A840TUF8_9BACT|nr:SAM-dependent methyltransferase [Rhabdobacter roseus]MBB5285202.1 16S rRNA (cytidine1402-2'-O)-methyltransferase [Rhabdobacter roseus]
MSVSPPKHTTTLFLIPTVLAEGTAERVLSPQVREVIQPLDVFFVENVRTARRFISGLRLGKVIDALTFFELTKDTPEADTAAQLCQLPPGSSAGVLSEAGCPGVADPGAVAVRLAHALGYRVVPLVGPSSILLALMASGLSGQSFAFHGYLPIDKAQRRKALQQLERDAHQRQQTQLFMETPFRNNQLLEAILEACQPDTLLCIASNLTAPDEFIQTRPVKQWRAHRPDLHKKPTIFVLGLQRD